MATKTNANKSKSSLLAPASPIASCQRSYAAAARALNSPRLRRLSGADETVTPAEQNLLSLTPTSDNGDLFSPSLKCSGAEDDEGYLGNGSDSKPAQIAVVDNRAATAKDAAMPTNAASYEEGDGAQEEEEDEEWGDFNPFFFIKSLPPYEEVIANRIVPTLLPKRTRSSMPTTLVLDLDETLVHCSIEPIANADIKFCVDFGGLSYQVYVRKRPYLHQFLEAVSKKFEVIVFTASQRIYAEKLLNLIDPHRNLIKYRLYRDSCLEVCDNFLKDLNVLGRDLKSTIIVDNSPHAFGYQVSNGIPIGSWFDDKNDTELLDLLPILEDLRTKDDVRPHIREYYQMHKTIEAS